MKFFNFFLLSFLIPNDSDNCNKNDENDAQNLSDHDCLAGDNLGELFTSAVKCHGQGS